MPWQRLSVLFAAVVAVGILWFVGSKPEFLDPDAFYHAKMALMIRDQGFVHAFPWLQETVLRDTFVDSHLLYHVLLIPFVTLFDPMVGMHASAFFFGLLACYALYRVLRSMDAPFPEWITLAAVLSFDFMQRMSMAKAVSLSVALFLAGTWATVRSRPRVLFFLAVAYVWTYNGWPILLAAYACCLVAWFVTKRLCPEEVSWSPVKTGVALFSGVLVGLVANPYFPENVRFVLLEAWKVVLTRSANVPVGTEWLPAVPSVLFLHNSTVFFALAISIALFAFAYFSRAVRPSSGKAREAIAYGLLALLLAERVSHAVRFVEYLVPSVLLFSGALLALSVPFLRSEIAPQARRLAGPRAIRAALAVVGAVAVAFIVRTASLVADHSVSHGGYYAVSQYEGSAGWLREHVAPGTTVFNAHWGASVIYFYLNDGLYSLVGLDPRLMAEADANRYAIWLGLQTGRDPDVSKIQDTFGTDVVVADRRYLNFIENIGRSDEWIRAYQDEWIDIYVTKVPL